MSAVDFSTKFSKGVAPANYTPNLITEVGSMIGKVAEQIIREVDADDRLSIFAKTTENGDTIEQAIIKLVESTAYDSTGANALVRSNPSLVVRYFNDWTRATWKTTVDMSQLRKVLQTGKGASDVASKIVGVLSESDKYEKYGALKSLLAKAKAVADGGDSTQGSKIAGALVNYGTVAYSSGIQYKKVLTALKNAVSKMTYVNSSCNSASLLRRTRMEDIVIIMPYTLKNEIDVEELAGVFNLDKAELGKKIIEIDTDAVSKYNYIYVLDKNAILDYTRLYEMADQKNADGLFWNYYLHVERLFGVSPLFDAGYIKVGVEA